MKVLFATMLLSILACGKKTTPALPGVDSPLLQAQVERIEPQLLMCDGGIADPRKNNIDGRPMCDVGDSVSAMGWVCLVSSKCDLHYLSFTVSEDGRPWRAPSYVWKSRDNSFSRDGFIGHIEHALSTGDTSLLRKVYDFAKRNGGALCDDANDKRCELTPSVELLARDVLGERVNGWERAQDEATVLAEASSVPGNYQHHLVGRKILLHAMRGNLTPGYRKASQVLASRYPRSLWLSILNSFVQGHDVSEDSVAAILSCMEAWKEPGHGWLPSYSSGCVEKANGHDLVAIARFLQRTSFH